MDVRPDCKYTESHEWVKVEGETGTVGITDHAQAELGDIVFVDLPVAGRMVSKGEIIGSIESVKAVSDIYAPVSGEIVDTNGALGSQSELVNSAPFDAGYLCKVKLSDPAEVDALLTPDQYSASIS